MAEALHQGHIAIIKTLHPGSGQGARCAGLPGCSFYEAIGNGPKGGEIMELFIRKLTPELLEDWLSFFDKDAFSDNEDWCGCYCMCYHYDEELDRKRAYGCDRSSAKFNRKQAIRLIKSGRMQGYLAYVQGKVVGWCNSNDKKAYDNVNFNFAEEVPDNGEKIKSVVCFSVAPQYRGHGVATALLEYLCNDAKADGFDLVEAYPFAHNENHGYHGPLSMYQRNGFEPCDQIEGCVVCRKKL